MQANGIEAKRIKAAERRKQRLYGEAIRDSSAFKEQRAIAYAAAAAEKAAAAERAAIEKKRDKKITIHLGSLSTSTSSGAHHCEPWVLQAMDAQHAISGGIARRQGEHGPEGPGFTRLPMV